MDEVIEDVVEKSVETISSNGVNEVTTVMESVTQEAVSQTKSFFHIDEIKNYFESQGVIKIIVSLLMVVIFITIFSLFKKLLNGKLKSKFQVQTVQHLNKILNYVFYILLGMYILSLFGVDFTAIWGAAGVAGLAIGFAAQTSVSNLISGLFVFGEKSVKPGDYISVGDVSGTVDTIGLLSIKVSTLENQVVRIPNSTVISSNLMNYNAHKIRRFYFEIPLDYSTDLEKALKAFQKIPSRCENVLQDPEPLVFYDGFGDGIIIKLAVWFKSTDLIAVKNQVYINVVKVCNEEDIIIPFNHYEVRMFDDEKNISWGTLANDKAVKAYGKKTVSEKKTVDSKKTSTVKTIKKSAEKKNNTK